LLSIGGEMSESKWKRILARKKPEPADARVMVEGQEMTGAQFNKMVSEVRKVGAKKYVAIKKQWDEDLSTPLDSGLTKTWKGVEVSGDEWNDMMRRLDKFGVKRGRSVLDFEKALDKMLKPIKARQAKGERWEKELAEAPKRKGEMSTSSDITAEEHNAMIARLKKYGKGKGYTEADYDRAWKKMTGQLERKKAAQEKKDDAAAAAQKAEGERTQMARTRRREERQLQPLTEQYVPPVEETIQDLIQDPEARRRYREREGLGLGTAPVSTLPPGQGGPSLTGLEETDPTENIGWNDLSGVDDPGRQAREERERLAAQESARPFGHKVGRFLREATLGGEAVGREAIARIPQTEAQREVSQQRIREDIKALRGRRRAFDPTLEELRAAIKRQTEAAWRGYQMPSEVEEFPVLW